MRLAAAIALLLLILFAGVASSLALTEQQISVSQHRWCALLTTIQPPRGQPVRPSAAQFYARLRALERQFGC